MDNLNELYCRLCADLKPSSNLSDMGKNKEKSREIIDKLMRLNRHVDFNNMLPKTVCLECINSLDRAYDFVNTMDLAQEAFEDYDTSALDISMNEVVSDDDTTEVSIEDDVRMKKGEAFPEDVSEESDKDSEIDPDPKTKLTDKNSKYKLKKEVAKTKVTVLKKAVIHKPRNELKVPANEDRDPWRDYNWLCAYCDKYFLNPSELKVHSMQYHTTCNPYRCYDCRARGLHMDNFVTHIYKHRPDLTLTCHICSVTCETLKDMKTHKAMHIKTDYACRGCNTTFSSQEELDDHMKKFYKDAVASLLPFHPNDDLKCVICGRTTKTKLLLNRHLLLHTDRKRTHVCDICGDSFYNKKEVVQHQSVHSNERPYKCEVCKFSFKLKQELKKHASIHFGRKQFACEQCGKCFRLSKELVIHSAVHKDIRPFKCTHCTKNFRFRHLLMQHLRLHTGTKPYSCDICSLKFRNWSNHNKHKRDVHGVISLKRKRTSEGLYALDPVTKEVIYPDKDKVLEWKTKILADVRKGRPKRIAKDVETEEKSIIDLDDQESDG